MQIVQVSVNNELPNPEPKLCYMNLSYYGQSCFSVEINEKTLLFDPFISPNHLAKHIDVDKIKADYILLSHGHSDHITDCISIAGRTGAELICCWEIHEWLLKKELLTLIH